MLHITRAAYSNSFQVSGNPGRHQWLQSTPAWSPLYADGWASFLNWDRVVISSKNTGFLILLNTFLTTSTSGGFPAGYIDPDNGCCSPLQSFEADFHSLPLSLTTYHDFRRNFKIRVEGRYKVYIYQNCIWCYLLIVSGRNSLEEDFGFSRIDILVNPSSPCGQPFVKCHEAVHVFGYGGAVLYVVPSATTIITWFFTITTRLFIEKWKKTEIVVRLSFSFVSPPMPWIKYQHVHSLPRIPLLNRTQIQYSPNFLSCYIN